MNQNLELHEQNSGFYYGWTLHFREEDKQWDVVDPTRVIRGTAPDTMCARCFIDGWREGEAAERRNREGGEIR